MSDAGELLLVLYEHIRAAAPVRFGCSWVLAGGRMLLSLRHASCTIACAGHLLVNAGSCWRACQPIWQSRASCPTLPHLYPLFLPHPHPAPPPLSHASQAEAAAGAVDSAFGLHIAEAVRCQKCGRVTQEGRYTQVGPSCGLVEGTLHTGGALLFWPQGRMGHPGSHNPPTASPPCSSSNRSTSTTCRRLRCVAAWGRGRTLDLAPACARLRTRT